MARPLSDLKSRSRHIVTPDGFTVDLLQTVARGNLTFYRQATADGRGGGFVAESSYVPEHIAIPWDCVVYENTRVLDTADLVSSGPRISGNMYRISEILRDHDLPLLELAAQCRQRLHAEWRAPRARTAPYGSEPTTTSPRFGNGLPRGIH